MARRKMSETITPSEEAFLAEGRPQTSRHGNKHESLQTSLEEGLITVTFRLPPSLVKQLQRTATERKLARQRPYSQQEIVAEAIREWIGKRGRMAA
jgi:hypothetical protein